MPIDIYTGQPGNGKTALMMERLVKEVEKNERPIYASGIEGLQPGLVNVLDDPADWNKKDSEGNYLVPDGSLIFVDEAWKWFGHMTASAGLKAPSHVLALAEHRHRGLDFVWTTQSPAQLYPFARTLIADHYHVVRRFGTSFLDVYHWGELVEDVKSPAKRGLAQKTTRRLPSSIFDKYKSATLHTIKRRVPWRVWLLPVVLLAALVALFFGYKRLRPESVASMVTKGTPAASVPLQNSSMRVAASSEPLSRDDYIKRQIPRVADQPWSSELYDNRPVVSDPSVFCMSSSRGLDGQGSRVADSCTCLTEQGTRYGVKASVCREIARHGPSYNPFRDAKAQEQLASRGTAEGRTTAASDHSSRYQGAPVSGSISGVMGSVGGSPVSASSPSF